MDMNYPDEPGLEGIQRLQVFCYDEEYNLLYPIQSEYDIVNNTVSASVSELGNYCLIDMDEWIEEVGIEPAAETPVLQNEFPAPLENENISMEDPCAIEITGDSMLDIDSLESQIVNAVQNSPDVGPSQYNRFIDLVFVVDVSGSMQGTINSCKEKIQALYADLSAVGIISRIAVVTFYDYSAEPVIHSLADGTRWAMNANDAQALINTVNVVGGGYENHLDALNTVSNLDYNPLAVRFAVIISDEPIVEQNNTCGKTVQQIDSELCYEQITTFAVCADYSFYWLNHTFSGLPINIYSDFNTSVYNEIYYVISQMRAFHYIGANNMCSNTLDTALVKDGTTDSDNDGLTDWNEVDGDFLINNNYVDENDYIIALPTLLQYLNAICKSGDTETFDRFSSFDYNGFYGINILPIKSDPKSMDGDGDGLYDGTARIINDKKVTPKDPDPLKANGPVGIWQAQFSQELLGKPAHELGSLYAFPFDWSSLEGGIHSPVLTAVGGFLLYFRMDEKGNALHSHVETWQKLGGYNDLYDAVFHFGTNGNMDNEKFIFNYDYQNYVIWVWRGDYLNCGSGAEIGIYENPHYLPIVGIEQWDAVDFTLPMTLNLYNYYDQNNIDNIFCWAPYENQWWITGFNPAFNRPDVTKMVSLGTIDFSSRQGMYGALKEYVQDDKRLRDYMIFDDDSHTVWLIWWGGNSD